MYLSFAFANIATLSKMKVATKIRNKMNGQTQIIMPHGAAKELGQALNVSQPTIREALRYKSDTATARKIRYTVIKEFGGVETKKR